MSVATFEESKARFVKHVGSDTVSSQHDAISEFLDRRAAHLIVHVRAGVVSEPNARFAGDLDVFIRQVYPVSENRSIVQPPVLRKPLNDADSVFYSRVLDVAQIFGSVNVQT